MALRAEILSIGGKRAAETEERAQDKAAVHGFVAHGFITLKQTPRIPPPFFCLIGACL
jgi:hypothetical protein